MLPQHIDVDIPAALRDLERNLLATFWARMTAAGYACETVVKEPGNHRVPWFLKVRLDQSSPTLSTATFGET